MSHGDSAISHPRDQDYLSLKVGQGSEVELQQALAYMVANIHEREREEKQRTDEKLSDPETTYVEHNTRPCSLPGLRREETITATHAVDAF